MASNEQILDVLADMRVEIAAIPNIKEQADELVRVVKGHNGYSGLTTRTKMLEEALKGHLSDYQDIRVLVKEQQEKTEQSFIGMRKEMSSGFGTIKTMLEDHIRCDQERDESLAKEKRDEERDTRKDKRKFRYDLFAAIALLVLDIVLSLIGIY
jgi:hypothetical protein